MTTIHLGDHETDCEICKANCGCEVSSLFSAISTVRHMRPTSAMSALLGLAMVTSPLTL